MGRSEVLQEYGGSIPPCTIYDIGPIEALEAAIVRLEKEDTPDSKIAIQNAKKKIEELEHKGS